MVLLVTCGFDLWGFPGCAGFGVGLLGFGFGCFGGLGVLWVSGLWSRVVRCFLGAFGLDRLV